MISASTSSPAITIRFILARVGIPPEEDSSTFTLRGTIQSCYRRSCLFRRVYEFPEREREMFEVFYPSSFHVAASHLHCFGSSTQFQPLEQGSAHPQRQDLNPRLSTRWLLGRFFRLNLSTSAFPRHSSRSLTPSGRLVNVGNPIPKLPTLKVSSILNLRVVGLQEYTTTPFYPAKLSKNFFLIYP